MARKRKKRKQRRSEQQAAASAVSPSPAETPLVVSEPTPSPHSSAPPVAPPTDEIHEALVADPDVDLDAGLDATESYESLVAAVAELGDDAPVPDANNGRTPDPAEEAEEIHDLDTDAETAGSVHRLIAQVGRSAATEVRTDDFVDDVPVIDLDDGVPPADARPRAVAAAPHVRPDVSRLARAAAAGALDDTEPAAIPLDLFGDISTPEARARLLAEALAHAEHKEARYRVPLSDTRRAARWKSAVAALLVVLAGVVAVAPPAWVRPEPPAQLTDSARARGLRLALILQAHQIDAYRIRTQQLPASLADLPATLDGVRYMRSGRSYQLVAFTPTGDAIVYDAADPSPAIRVLEGALAAAVAP